MDCIKCGFHGKDEQKHIQADIKWILKGNVPYIVNNFIDKRIEQMNDADQADQKYIMLYKVLKSNDLMNYRISII